MASDCMPANHSSLRLSHSYQSGWFYQQTHGTPPRKKKNKPLLPPPPKKSVSTSYLTLISFLIYRVAIIAVVTMLVGFVAIKAMVFGKDVEYFSR